MARVYKLGGRIFSPAESLTARQDGYLRATISDTGLVDIVAGMIATARADDTPDVEARRNEDMARKLVIEAYRTGTLFHVVAGWLTEVGTKWTIKDANANGEAFGELTDEDEQTQLSTAFVEAITHFFTKAVRSLTPTATFSANQPERPSRSASDAPSTGTGAVGPTAPDSSLAATATA